MLHYISNLESVWGPFRLFNYLSFRCVLAAVTAFLIAFAFAPRVIRFFRAKKAFQIQRNAEIMGKTAELHSWKEGTPCMGGLIIFAGVMVSALLWCKINTMVVAALSVYAILTATGFADDYLKLLKGNSNGIKGKTKIFWQITASATAGAILFTNPAYAHSMQELWLPFVKTCVWVMPIIVAIAFLALVISSSSNALNLTDGLDGLATGCTISVVLAYGIFAYVTGNQIAAEYLSFGYIPDCGELAVLCCTILGAAMAFLWFNCYPAYIWMGDTGSLGLGGIIGVIAFMVHQPITLILVGGVFVMETMSVIIQTRYYKLTGGKRIFRKSPIHHHFEEGGWKETQVVIRFWILSLIFALAGLATLKLR